MRRSTMSCQHLTGQHFCVAMDRFTTFIKTAWADHPSFMREQSCQQCFFLKVASSPGAMTVACVCLTIMVTRMWCTRMKASGLTALRQTHRARLPGLLPSASITAMRKVKSGPLTVRQHPRHWPLIQKAGALPSHFLAASGCDCPRTRKIRCASWTGKAPTSTSHGHPTASMC